MRTTQYSSHGFRCVRNIEDDSVLTNDELSSTSHPENWLFFDDFEGEEKKIYIDTEGNSKGDVVQIDDSNVLSLQCDSNGSTTIGFQELLEIADTLDDYAIEFDMLMSDSSRADTVYFEVLLRSNFLPYGRFSSTQYIGEIRIGGADGFGDTIRMTYSTPGRDEAISLSGSSNINGKIPKYIRENTWYHQRLEIQGQKISWYIDNNLQLRAEDSRIQTGIPAIYCSRGQFYLDNILVESIE
jgi:hypothetical protein